MDLASKKDKRIVSRHSKAKLAQNCGTKTIETRKNNSSSLLNQIAMKKLRKLLRFKKHEFPLKCGFPLETWRGRS